MTSHVLSAAVTGISTKASSTAASSVGGFVTRAMIALDEGAIAAGQATRLATKTAIRFFYEIHGDIMTDEISEIHVNIVIRELCSGSVYRGNRKHRGFGCSRGPEDEQEKHTRSAKTIEQYMSSLAATWNYLHAEGHETNVANNPFIGHNLPKTTSSNSAGLSAAEIERIFALPVYAYSARPSGRFREASYWVPLFLLLTGAKPEQIARLTVNDLHDGPPPSGGVTLTISCAEAKKGDRKLKTGRHFSSTRTFPLPRLLIELGILDYATWVRSRGENKLFAELKPRGPNNERFPGFELWWEGHLRSLKAFPKGCRPARAFQKTWITQARRCGISAEAQDYILGRKGLSNFQNSLSQQVILGSEMLKLDTLNYNLSNISRWAPA